MAKYECMCTYFGQHGEPENIDTIEAESQEEADKRAAQIAIGYMEVEGWAVKVEE